jgi:hypothetical protein
MFIIHPKDPREPPPAWTAATFCFMLHAGTSIPETIYRQAHDDDRSSTCGLSISRVFPGIESVGGTERAIALPHSHRQHEHARSPDPHTRLSPSRSRRPEAGKSRAAAQYPDRLPSTLQVGAIPRDGVPGGRAGLTGPVHCHKSLSNTMNAHGGATVVLQYAPV